MRTNRIGTRKITKSFSSQIMLFVLTVCLVLIISFLLLVYYPAEKLILNTNIDKYKDTLSEKSAMASSIIRNAEAMSLLYYHDVNLSKDVENMANGVLSAADERLVEEALYAFTYEILNMSREMTRVDIRIGDFDTYAIRYSNEFERRHKYLSPTEEMLERCRENRGGTVLFHEPDRRATTVEGDTIYVDDLYMITLGRTIKNHYTLVDIGTIFLDVDIESCFTDLDDKQGGERLYLVDGDGEIVCGTAPIHTSLFEQAVRQKSESEIRDGSEKYHILKKTVRGTDYQLYYLIENHVLTNNLSSMRNKTMMIIITLFIVVLLITFFFCKRIFNRLRKITLGIDNYKQGNLQYRIEENGQDEISAIADDINEMGGKIHTLMQNNLMRQQKQQEMEKEVLRNQINPHFLFNSLESIQMLAVMKEEREISSMVGMLGKLLRMGMGESEEIITVQQELDFIALYLKMCKIRYEDQISYEILVDENVREEKMLKFILQPIVENAISHGLENKVGSGFVRITAARKDENIYLSVEDNGIGIEQEQLERLKKQLDEPPERGKGIGMKNIYDRIKLFYGNKGKFSMESSAGSGTRIALRLPVISEDTKPASQTD